MKTIVDRFFELFNMYGENKSALESLKIINKEYFNSRLNIEYQYITNRSCRFIRIDDDVFEYWDEAIDKLENLYQLMSIKRKIDNINENGYN